MSWRRVSVRWKSSLGEIGQSVANTSHHLRSLAQAGLVRTRRDGTRIYYALASDRVGELWAALRDVAAEHVAGIDRLAAAYLGDHDGAVPMTREELTRRLRRRDVLVIDVRPEAEYDAGHIPGARSLPPAEVRKRLRELPKNVQVVAYCRGPFCVYADDAVRLLRRRGVEARAARGRVPGMETCRFGSRGWRRRLTDGERASGRPRNAPGTGAREVPRGRDRSARHLSLPHRPAARRTARLRPGDRRPPSRRCGRVVRRSRKPVLAPLALRGRASGGHRLRRRVRLLRRRQPSSVPRVASSASI